MQIVLHINRQSIKIRQQQEQQKFQSYCLLTFSFEK